MKEEGRERSSKMVWLLDTILVCHSVYQLNRLHIVLDGFCRQRIESSSTCSPFSSSQHISDNTVDMGQSANTQTHTHTFIISIIKTLIAVEDRSIRLLFIVVVVVAVVDDSCAYSTVNFNIFSVDIQGIYGIVISISNITKNLK